MTQRATDFLINLSVDPRAFANFKENPRVAVNEAGLSVAEQALILSGDPVLIQQALANDTGFDDGARIANPGIVHVVGVVVAV